MGQVEERAEESAEHVGAHDKQAYVGAALGRAHRGEGGKKGRKAPAKSPFRRRKEESQQKSSQDLTTHQESVKVNAGSETQAHTSQKGTPAMHIPFPETPFKTEEEAMSADTYRTPADRAAITGGTEKQNAYAVKLRDRYIAERASDRFQHVRRRGNDQLYQNRIDRTVDGGIINRNEDDIAEAEEQIARAARSTNAKFWLKLMGDGGDASRVTSHFRTHPAKAAK